MSVLASLSAPVLIPSIVAAVGAVTAALIGAVAVWRAQTAEDQLEAIRLIVRDATDRIRGYIDQATETIETELGRELDARSRGIVIGEIVRRVVREVLNTDPRFSSQANPERKE